MAADGSLNGDERQLICKDLGGGERNYGTDVVDDILTSATASGSGRSGHYISNQKVIQNSRFRIFV